MTIHIFHKSIRIAVVAAVDVLAVFGEEGMVAAGADDALFAEEHGAAPGVEDDQGGKQVVGSIG